MECLFRIFRVFGIEKSFFRRHQGARLCRLGNSPVGWAFFRLSGANGFNECVGSMRRFDRNPVVIWDHYLSHINGTRGACC
ncbi:hypothetical protein D3C77_558210 [compost metagenome]